MLMRPRKNHSSFSSPCRATERALRKHCLMLRIVALVLVIQMLFATLMQAELLSSDAQALKSIRNSLEDMPGSSFFDSWDFSKDPCSFGGVICDLLGSGIERVIILNLGEAMGDSPGLRGRLTSALGSLSALSQLTLVPGMVAGAIPESLGSLTNLVEIGLSNNLLSGIIPASFGNLQHLDVLDLSYNRLVGGIPERLGAIPTLRSLIICHNALTGIIPTFKSSLIHLDLKQNALGGALPTFPSSIVHLSLSYNQLSGPLQNLVTLENLGYLDLSFNRFSGSVPSAIFEFRLTSLFLQRNQLSGTINPTALVIIPTVDLSYNKFSGRISPFLAFVQNLYLNNNLFTGVVPQEFVDQLSSASIQTLFLQHNYLTDFNLNPSVPLPVTCSLCIQYNCMLPPIRSPCPSHAGREQSRPAFQCSTYP